MKHSTQKPCNPNFLAIAETLGAKGKKVKTPSELLPSLYEALISGDSWVIDVEIDPNLPGYRSVWYPYPNNLWLTHEDMTKQI